MHSNNLAIAEAAPAERSERLNSLLVLIVEDDDGDAYLIERALSDHARPRYILRAIDGVDALEMLELGVAPDVAIIDLHMPRKDGFSLLVDMLGLPKPFPVIVLTSSTAPSDSIRSRLRGANCFLTKSDSVEGLRAALATAIESVGVA